jgi:hypothetical protein
MNAPFRDETDPSTDLQLTILGRLQLNDDEDIGPYLKALDAASFTPPLGTILDAIKRIHNGKKSPTCKLVGAAIKDDPGIKDHPDFKDLQYSLGGMLADAQSDKRDTAQLIKSLEKGDHNVVRIHSSSEFVRDFLAPSYLWEGVLVGGNTYSLTGQTGSGKTAVSLTLAASVAQGKEFCGRDVQQGSVLMLAGENADDVRARWIGLSEDMGFDADKIDVHFIPNVFSIKDFLPQIRKHAESVGDLKLVNLDTAAAYFMGNEENSNTELGNYARELREGLTGLPGNPCVLINCHPTKSSTSESLEPRGGGAFVCEMDGNLTCSITDSLVSLHWWKKIRGPGFEPMQLELKTIYTDRVVDADGNQMPTVVARPLSESEQRERAEQANDDIKTLLRVMRDNSNASLAALAEAAGWRYTTGDPDKSKVRRLMKHLEKLKYARKELNVWVLSANGENAARKLSNNPN